jgi:hypothetical protein
VPNNGEINERFGVYKSFCWARRSSSPKVQPFLSVPIIGALRLIWNFLDFEMILMTEFGRNPNRSLPPKSDRSRRFGIGAANA